MALLVILALSAVTTVPLMTYTGRAAGTVTLTARYSLETVSVTGTVAVVVPAASAPVERENTSARARKNAGMVFRFIKPAFLRQGQPPQREPPAAVLWFIRLAVGFFSYAAVSHSTMNTTFATVAPVTAEDSGVTMAA